MLVLASDAVRLAARAEMHGDLVGREHEKRRVPDEVEDDQSVDNLTDVLHSVCSFKFAIQSSVSSSTDAFNS